MNILLDKFKKAGKLDKRGFNFNNQILILSLKPISFSSFFYLINNFNKEIVKLSEEEILDFYCELFEEGNSVRSTLASFLKNSDFVLALQNWIFYENSCLDNNKSNEFIGELFIKASESLENNMFYFYSQLVNYGYKLVDLKSFSQFEIIDLAIKETKLRGLTPFLEFLNNTLSFFPDNEKIIILRDSTKADLDSIKANASKKPSGNNNYSQLERM